MYTIINPDTNEYFSLLNGGLFTSNKEIASRFDSVESAMLCTEQMIDSLEGFDKFGMIFTEIVTIK